MRLTAYSQLGGPRLTGRIVHISADRLADPRTGLLWYEARVALDPDQPGCRVWRWLVPGMPAEVMIVTGACTPIDYLLTLREECRVPPGSREAGQPPWAHRADYLPWLPEDTGVDG